MFICLTATIGICTNRPTEGSDLGKNNPIVRKSVLVAHYKFIMLFFCVYVCRFTDFVMSFAWLVD